MNVYWAPSSIGDALAAAGCTGARALSCAAARTAQSSSPAANSSVIRDTTTSARRTVPVSPERLHQQHGGDGAPHADVDSGEARGESCIFSRHDLQIAGDPALVAQVRLVEC